MYKFYVALCVFLIGPVQAPIFAQDAELQRLQAQLNQIQAALDSMKVPQQAPAQGNALAVCRQFSHGASCTVVWTGRGKSYLLGCAHAYEGREKRITLDVPSTNAIEKRATSRLVALDREADLSLVELSDGPLQYVLPIAPEGFRPSRNVRAAGYDGMKLPGVNVGVHLTSMQYTQERPIPGRSGGALFDADSGYLIGVCHGYELTYKRRGIYVDHRTILAFVQAKGYGWLVSGCPVQPYYPPAKNYRQLCPT